MENIKDLSFIFNKSNNLIETESYNLDLRHRKTTNYLLYQIKEKLKLNQSLYTKVEELFESKNKLKDLLKKKDSIENIGIIIENEKGLEIKIEEIVDIVNREKMSINIDYSEYMNYMKLQRKNIIAEQIINTAIEPIRIIRGKHKGVIVTIAKKIEYDYQNNIISIDINENIIRELLLEKNGYTPIDLNIANNIKNKYGVILYEILEKYKNLDNGVIFDLLELKKIIGAIKKEKNEEIELYPKIWDFRKELRKSFEELNQINVQTGEKYKYDFEEIKEGKKVTKIKFITIKEINKKNSDNIESGDIEKEAYKLYLFDCLEEDEEVDVNKYPTHKKIFYSNDKIKNIYIEKVKSMLK